MTNIDHIVVLLFAFLYPAYDYFYASRKFKKEAEANVPRVRIRAYISGITLIWILNLIMLFSWIINYREAVLIGLNFSVDWTVWTALGLLILGPVYTIYLYQSLKSDKDQINSVRTRMGGGTTSLFLPRTGKEYGWFVFVSISAGICEELLYRGFLLWYLDQFSPMVIAVILSSLIFGLAHAYQGRKGILQTGLIGLGMAIIYMLTGTLWIPIVLHIVIDIYSGMLGWIAFKETVYQNEN